MQLNLTYQQQISLFSNNQIKNKKIFTNNSNIENRQVYQNSGGFFSHDACTSFKYKASFL